MLIVKKRELVAGRTVLGPRKIASTYARIVARSDGSGRIEKFDGETNTWVMTDAISFSDIWTAPEASPLIVEQMLSAPGVKS